MSLLNFEGMIRRYLRIKGKYDVFFSVLDAMIKTNCHCKEDKPIRRKRSFCYKDRAVIRVEAVEVVESLTLVPCKRELRSCVFRNNQVNGRRNRNTISDDNEDYS